MESKKYFYRFYKNEDDEKSGQDLAGTVRKKNENVQNIITYTEQTMDSFDRFAFGDVDALVLSWLSYIDFPDICIQDEPVRLCDLYKAEYFEEMYSSAVAPEETKALFNAAAASPRFRDIGVSHYVSRLDPETLKQFSAVNFHISDDLRFIAFRGTDKYITGWKEDLCLALPDPVESQKSSVRYLKRCAGDFEGEIQTGGHSKGGNLAVYSAALSDESVQNKITRIYSFDGPGFDDEQAEPLINSIYSKVVKIVPASSVIGQLLETRTGFKIVKSDKHGFAQHMAFYWHIVNGFFEYANDLTYDSKVFGKSVNKWISSLEYEERAEFIRSLFELFSTANVETLDDIDFMKALPEIKKNFDEMTPESRKNLLSNVREIMTGSIRSQPKALEIRKN